MAIVPLKSDEYRPQTLQRDILARFMSDAEQVKFFEKYRAVSLPRGSRNRFMILEIPLEKKDKEMLGDFLLKTEDTTKSLMNRYNVKYADYFMRLCARVLYQNRNKLRELL
jgi:hypothetical protein